MKVLRSAEDRSRGAYAKCAPRCSVLRLALLHGLLVIAACDTAQVPKGKSPPTRIANPASVHCVERGGRLEIAVAEGGQVGICVLPDGRSVEEWALYREAQGGDASMSR
jgi:hypothetical protein